MTKTENLIGNIMLGIVLGAVLWAFLGSFIALYTENDATLLEHHGGRGSSEGYVDFPY